MQTQPEINLDDLTVSLPNMKVGDVNKILYGLGFVPHRDSDHLLKGIKAHVDSQVAKFIEEASKQADGQSTTDPTDEAPAAA